MSVDSNRAVFLDRDGVLNRALVRNGKPYPPRDLSELEIPANTREDLERLRKSGFKLIVVTNQPDIARGIATRASIELLNEHLRRELPLDDILMCPHDNQDGCDCRKPRPGLLLRAAERYGLDPQKSFMVGDRWTDVDAGNAAGCFTVLIDYHYCERGPTAAPAARVSSLHEAVDIILKQARNEEIQ